MRINTSFKVFKNTHLKKKHQLLFTSKNCKNYSKVENLYKFLLAEKNSFIFESVEKGVSRGRYTIIGLNPDKIWDINKNTVTIISERKKSFPSSGELNFTVSNAVKCRRRRIHRTPRRNSPNESAKASSHLRPRLF